MAASAFTLQVHCYTYCFCIVCVRATTLSLKHTKEAECRFKTEADLVSLTFLCISLSKESPLFAGGNLPFPSRSAFVFCMLSLFFPSVCVGSLYNGHAYLGMVKALWGKNGMAFLT